MRVLYAQAVYGREEIDAVVEVLSSKSLALMNGPSVREFEARVAKLFGKQHGLMVNSGSSANLIAIAALDLPRGSEVITPVLTFSTTVAPLLQHGLVPAFVDVELDTFNIDTDQIEAMITPNTRGMIVPNLLGNLPAWDRLRAIADRHSLRVVEDSADTIGSTFRGAPTGALSDISTTSFYASHVVTAGGFGGAVSTNDADLARRAKLLSGWGRSSSLTGESERIEERFSSSIDGIPYDNKFIFDAVGYNFLPSEMGAAFGLVQLQRLSEYSARRQRNFARLREFFSQFEEWLVLPRQQAHTSTSWLAFPLIVKKSAPFSRRDLQVHFETNQIQTRPVFTGNILRQPGFRQQPAKKSSRGYPNADRVMEGGLLVGCHQGIGDAETDYICAQFEKLARSL